MIELPTLLLLATSWLGCGPGPGAESLSEVEHLNRASMAIRGLRPTVEEVEAIQRDPSAIEGLVDQWLDSDAFGETIKDLHAELFLLRADTNFQLPVKGVLEERGYNQADVHMSTVEAPLEFVREIVLTDQPYSEILTADYTVANEVVAAIYGLPFDPDGPTWQHTKWTDGRPQSGLLSDSEIWRRHVSNAANFHRGRANFVSSAFLCEDIGARDVFVDGGVDVSDPFEVADTVAEDPGCVACHNVLEPMAAFFWGFKEQLQRGAVLQAYDRGCEWNWADGPPPSAPPRDAYRIEHWCYPLKFYDVAEEGAWQDWGLQPPGYFGQPAADLRDLGQLVVDDPRFATCTVRNVAGYLTQTKREDISLDWVRDLQSDFVASGFSIKSLVRDVVLSDSFRAAKGPDAIGLQTIRPEQLSRTLDQVTGFQWIANQDAIDCETVLGSNTCWGRVDLLRNDLYGVRSMMGGIDGYTVTHPTHTPTPVAQLALRVVASEAAGHVVDADFALPAEQRRLLSSIEPGDTSTSAVRTQIADLYLRILAQPVSPQSRDVDLALDLFRSATDASGDPRVGWKVVVTALLRDPSMVLY